MDVISLALARKALDPKANVYEFKGSCAFEDLPEEAFPGEVWNITDDFDLDGKHYEAGTNIAYTNDGWDALTASIDTSIFELNANKVTSLSDQSTNEQYPSAKAVFDMIKDNAYKTGIYQSQELPFIFSNKTPGIYVYDTTQYPYRDFTYKKTSSDAVQTISNVYTIMVIYTRDVNKVPAGSVATLGYLLYASNSGADSAGNICTAEFRLKADGSIIVIKTTYDNSNLRVLTPGEQRITQGKKRFDIIPEISYAQTPTRDLQLVHKKYVDDAIANIDISTATSAQIQALFGTEGGE